MSKIEVLQITMKDTADGFQELLKNNNIYVTKGEKYYSIPKFFKELPDNKFELLSPDQVPDKVRKSIVTDYLTVQELQHMIKGVYDLPNLEEITNKDKLYDIYNALVFTPKIYTTEPKVTRFEAGDKIFFKGYNLNTHPELEARVVNITEEDLVNVRPYNATTDIGAGKGNPRLFTHKDLKELLCGWYKPYVEGSNGRTI